ncbi:hypothetical protein HRG84_11980 [Flavisolibacter sp. BT320]|nr:hypothetical protein [Flavisolibacter longurius]
MTNERDITEPLGPGRENEETTGHDRVEQFNELSELSLEERMNVADQMGIPVQDAGEAAATGRAGSDEDMDSREENRNETTMRPDR